jgi:hypothetical protein
MYPATAFWRKQMRQRPNFRNTDRGRPQTRQRRIVRVENFGFFAALIRIARVAMVPLAYLANGMPSAESNPFARSSRPAVVTIVTFRPFDLSVLA